MDVTAFAKARRPLHQGNWHKVSKYLLAGLFAVFLAACSSSYENVLPEFTSAAAISVVEGMTDTGYTATADDANGNTLTFSVSGGADAAQFSIDASTGALSFVTAADFDVPADADGDNDYEVQLTVDDGFSGTAALDLVVTVTSSNVAPAFTSAAAVSVVEGSTATGYTATASDGNAADVLTFSISGGADQAEFSIDSATGVLSFVNTTDFIAPTDADLDNDYEVQLTVDDGRTGMATLDLVVTVRELSNFSVELTYPTPNANLGGDATQTTMRGNIVDSSGAPINLADINYVDVEGQMATLDMVNVGRWSVQVPVTPGLNALDIELGLTSGSIVNSIVNLQNFAVAAGFSKLVVDSANNRALVVDAFLDGVLAVDLATGERSVVSGGGTGAGTAFNSPRDVALESANNRVLVVDWQRDALSAVDLTSGDRTDLSNANAGIGAGIALDGPQAVALDSANNQALVVATINDQLIAVDLATGDRTELSGPAAGAGPVFGSLRDVAVDAANNRALVADSLIDAIVAVDLASGDRTILSDAATGTGVAITIPESISLDTANNRLLVAEHTGLLIAVDLTSGNRTEIAETRSVYGVNGTRLVGVATDSANNQALLSDSTVDAIHAIDFATGGRTILSDSRTGSGDDSTSLSGVRGLALDNDRNRLVLTNSSNDSVMAIDLSSGDRSYVSNSSIGTGPVFTFPGNLDVDSANNRAVFPDLNAAPALFAVDLDSGDRTILSDNAGVGTGPAFVFPLDVVVDSANDRAGVLEQGALGLFGVDLITGDRTIASDGATGAGPLWTNPVALEIDIPNDVAYILDLVPSPSDIVVYSVDFATGDRAVVSNNSGIGTGPNMTFSNDFKLDAASNRVFVLNRASSNNLMAVDLTSGDRTILSGAGVGSGQDFIVPWYIEHDLANDRVFIFDLAVTGVLVVDLATGERAVMSK